MIVLKLLRNEKIKDSIANYLVLGVDCVQSQNKKSFLWGYLITLGIVYGDIGTSPLYVMNALISDAGGVKYLTKDYILGGLSLIFWTLMLMTTVKYVLIVLKADNHGEGGIFSLYSLVKNVKAWLIIPALIGGAALLADGTLTPAVTITSAIEGLKGVKFNGDVLVNSQTEVVVAVALILVALFSIQRYGTSFIGKAFGPLMLVWFLFLLIFGVTNLISAPEVLIALSPVYAIKMLFLPANKIGIFILGSIFLATTGAEALYSDIGHVGRRNIYGTWPFVCVALLLNYFGQGAYLLTHLESFQNSTAIINPFYEMLPTSTYLFGVVIATIAAIIASQALITGSFTLVEEAVGLKILPRVKVKHPAISKGQIYISSINWSLFVCTMAVLLYFQTSEHMEAAYGLAITVTMLMTTVLLYHYLTNKWNKIAALTTAVFFSIIESIFLIASLSKFVHGGYVTAIIMSIILAIMVIWFYGNRVRDRYQDKSEKVSLLDYRDTLQKLSNDEKQQMYIDNLVLLAHVDKYDYTIKREIIYSILDKHPKRAKVYWFVTVNTIDDPYARYYTVDMMDTNNIVSLQLYFGFKAKQSINLYLYQIVNDLMSKGIIDEQPQSYTTTPGRTVGDFCFILTQELLSPNTRIPKWAKNLISARIFIQNHSTNAVDWFGLEFSDVEIEKVPLFLKRRVIPPIQQRELRNLK